MCTGLELLAAAGATAATVSTVQQGSDARKQRKALTAQAEGAEAERKAAETQATQNAYAQTQFARKAMRENSLFTGGGTSAGRQTLGV